MSSDDLTAPASTPSVVNNEAESRYEIHMDGQLAGFADYTVQPGVIAIPHTEVDPAFEGRGLGSTLARAALDDIRQQGSQVAPHCPFIATYIKRHPEYADLVEGSATSDE